MKRARRKNSLEKNEKKHEYKFESDMIELGYDPDTFVENDGDVSARPESEEPEQENNSVTKENIEASEASKQKITLKNKKLLIFSVALVTIISIFVVAFCFGGFFSSSETEEEINEDYMVPVDKATGKINILILGVDKDGLRTDTIIVASYDLDNNKVNLLSIPRDTRMYVGKKYQKINAAHAISQSGKIKGPQGSIEAVTRLTCIPINYYVEFSFDAFKNTIDALGGVDFDVPRDMNYEDPTQKLYIHLKKGYQHLDGDKAEQLVRFRRYPEGDIARVQMQQNFIKTVAEQKLNIGIISKIPDLYDVLKDDIKTNFTILDVTKYLNNLKELSPENIAMFQLPGRFSGSEYSASYWIADMDELKTLVETEFGYDASKATIHSDYNSKEAKEERAKTSAPKASASGKSSNTTEKTATEKTAAPTKKPSKTSKPTDTAEPTHKTEEAATQKPTATHTAVPETTRPYPSVTPASTPKPMPTPTYTPAATTGSNETATVRPARPTPNIAASEDE